MQGNKRALRAEPQIMMQRRAGAWLQADAPGMKVKGDVRQRMAGMFDLGGRELLNNFHGIHTHVVILDQVGQSIGIVNR